jgi:hypothetical protein
MSSKRLAAILAALALVVSAVAVPGMAAADESLEVTVEQQADTGEALVTVTDGDGAVEDANVTVQTDDDYAGEGTRTTDANGTVTLPNPDGVVAVTLTVSHGGVVEEVETELRPRAESLAVAVEGGVEENATVTVTQYGEAVENATLDVDADDYAGNGTYRTDANGTVSLPTPPEPTEVTLNASVEGLSAERTVTLGEHDLEVDVEDDDGVTVEVTRNDTGVEGANVTVEAADGESYAGAGEYETDANGTVGLPTPEETVNVTVTATDGDETVSENVTLENETAAEYPTLGAEMSAFVHQLLSGAANGIGGEVSEFARENNPGNADDEEDGEADDEDEVPDEGAEERGGPEDVPGAGDEMRGGPNGEDDGESDGDDREEGDDEEGDDEEGDDEEGDQDEDAEEDNADDEGDEQEDDEGDEQEDDEDDDRRGPPSHANN